MKKKIMTLLLTATLIGGTGATTFAATTPNTTTSNCNYFTNLVTGLKDSKQINIKSLQDLQKILDIFDSKYSANNCATANATATGTVATSPTNTSCPLVQAPADKTTGTTSNTQTSTPVVQAPSTAQAPSTGSQSQTKAAPTTKNTTQAASSDSYIASVEQSIFQIVNQERAKAGLQALTYNTTMEKYARMKSKDMGDNNYFDHYDLSGNLMTAKMKADGVTYKAWGENIAYIGGSVDTSTLGTQFMTNWMNSPGHRANILSTNYSSIGVGVYKIGNKYYATQEFYK